jgi:hypothetical protein
MVQVVESLPSKHEALNLSPSTTRKTTPTKMGEGEPKEQKPGNYQGKH